MADDPSAVDSHPAPEGPDPGPRSRRAVLAAALGAAVGSVASALGHPPAVGAAAGDSLKLGQTNYAGTAATRLNTTSSGGAFWMTQNGTGSGVRGDSTSGHGGVFTTAHADRYGLNASTSGAEGAGAAVFAAGGQNHGLQATTGNFNRHAVHAIDSSGGGVAICGSSSGGSGLSGLTSSGEGVSGWADSGTGVHGTSTGGAAIYGESSDSHGGVFTTAGAAGYGVHARQLGGAGTGAAVQADGGSNHGLSATTANTGRFAVRAEDASGGLGTAIGAYTTAGVGIYGQSSSGIALYGASTSSYGAYGGSTSNAGVTGQSSSGYGVQAYSATGYGVYASSGSSYAGYFAGNLHVTSTLSAATVNATTKNFRIDHPLDPANKVLVHSCVESNERLTIYAGIVTTDVHGAATIVLPRYFEALNTDVRYQLTVIGRDARAWVRSKIKQGRFTIATSEPGTEVSWQVTGSRADAYARAHPLEVESAKSGREKGRYLNPVEHGQPLSAGIDPKSERPLRVRQPGQR